MSQQVIKYSTLPEGKREIMEVQKRLSANLPKPYKLSKEMMNQEPIDSPS